MFFTKYPHPANFSYLAAGADEAGLVKIGSRQFQIHSESFSDGTHHLSITAPAVWPSNRSLVALHEPAEKVDSTCWQGDHFAFQDENGHTVLRGASHHSFGVNGHASIFCIEVDESSRFFGMGEKNFGELELSGRRSMFWNTDVWSDFHFGQWTDHPTDPSYYSTPYLVVRTEHGYAGLLLHNPSPAYMETPGSDESRVFLAWQRTSRHLVLGSLDGEPNLWVLTAPTLADLTRKFQALVGKTPRPPIWSLGYQQSRWGYGGHEDMMRLDKKCAESEVPCTGLWLDIDHMIGYRVFTVDPTLFPKGIDVTADALAQSGRRMVPIIDPGVKFEPGYAIYDDGLKADIFCKNPEGGNYIGIVWPGETVYPDFTLSEGRSWWARYAAGFRKSGFGACWVDMNDPSTGPSEPDSMLFERGTRKHNEHRNQYALGMQMATFDGFKIAKPQERPFILSRSGCTGSSRYAAIWTGDNVSNDFHLKLAFTTVLGLAISGQPFAGADVGGFGGDTKADMLVRWTQAAFLSPFMRNHTSNSTTFQEPWAYDDTTLKITRHYIQLRHQFLPYLYNLFVRQEEDGSPMFRPVLFDFDDPTYDHVADQAMVGPWLLHAPIIERTGKARKLVLPGRDPWLDLRSGEWIKPGDKKVKVRFEDSPLYLRAGGLVPIQAKRPIDNTIDLLNPLVLVGVPSKWTGTSHATYVADDGSSYQYETGGESKIEIMLHAKKGSVNLTWQQSEDGFGVIAPRFAFFDKPEALTLQGQTVELKQQELTLTGGPLKVWVTA